MPPASAHRHQSLVQCAGTDRICVRHCDLQLPLSSLLPSEEDSKERALCIDTAPQRPHQFTRTLWKVAKRTMRVLATTFILIAAQCMPSCAVGGCFHSLSSCQNYSLLFHFKDNKVTSSWLIKELCCFPEPQSHLSVNRRTNSTDAQ